MQNTRTKQKLQLSRPQTKTVILQRTKLS